jgi:hypothetical protein
VNEKRWSRLEVLLAVIVCVVISLCFVLVVLHV